MRALHTRLSGRLLLLLWSLIIMTSAVINTLVAMRHAESIAMTQARTMFDQIVLTRSWNALHGGVYVPISESTRPNPYLKGAGRDVVTEQGVALTKINPAYMTRQISELAQQGGGVQFHITSLAPIRPQNAPAAWERTALERFEQGERESGEFLYKQQKYRYMAPLFTTKGCLKCHAEQGYKLGDIRGGISISYPAEEILHNREHAIINIVVAHLLVLLISAFAMRLYGRGQQRLQQMRVEKEGAEQANEFKGAFIATISHELRTPLNAILGMSHLLTEEGLVAGQLRHVQKIGEAGQRLNTLINHMLDVAQIDAGTMELLHSPFQLRALLQQAVSLMRERAENKGLSLTLDVGEGVPEWLLGDARHIQQILLHLLDNAIRFTDAGGVSVSVTTRVQEEPCYEIELVVTDSGIGMERSSDWLQRHDFTQMADYHTRSRGGVGLGLTLTRRLLQLMGGRLQIQSEAGHGTQVTVSLSLERTGPPAGEAPREAPRSVSLRGGEAEGWGPSAAQCEQLQQQLSQLVAALDSDYSGAMDSLAMLLEQYQGSNLQGALQSISERMAAFDSDGVMELCRTLEQRLLRECLAYGREKGE